MIPEIFAPGIISKGYFERSVVFSADHDELFFQLRCLGFTTVLLHMKQKNGTWSQPETACFSGIPEYSDAAPFFTYDGRRLFVSSQRPLPGTKEVKKDSDIWIIRKNKEEWQKPVHGGKPLNSDFDEDYPTVSKSNNLYFSSNREGNYDLYVSLFSEEGFIEPCRLASTINTENFEGHPFIAADESYLIFSSDRPGELGQGDLYISFKGKENEWLEPDNMGDKINSPFHEAAPYVSPDGEYLFFCSFRPNPPPYGKQRLTFMEIKKLLDGPGNGRGDVYWISARIIEEMKKK
ncbi:MAG: PD40 domain-containing protein [Candidatus Aminicenantes bacterium]|nr:PD40 domain-containing protein [Candidatus Aminicenantes bacterium]